MWCGLADSVLEAAELTEMVAQVNDVEAPPLVGAERAEDEVGGDALEAEALAATVEERIHLIDFLAEEIDEFVAVHRRPVELVWPGEDGSRSATGHATEGKHHELEEPLRRRAVVGGGAAALEPLLEDATGTAEGEREVLDEILGGPQALVLERVELTPRGRLAGQVGMVRIEDLLQNGMHTRASNAGPILRELYH